MSATACFTNQAKLDLMQYLAGRTLKMALFLQASATLSASSTTYSTTGELATANGYTQGGVTLTGVAASLSGTKAQLTANAAVWTSSGAGFTTDCAVVYDSANSHILGIYTFASTTASGGGTLTITPPADLLYVQ